jgi:energy-coupling factor transport system permease protein
MRQQKLHPVTWMIWSACASVVALLTRNPWYLLSLSVIALAIKWKATRERPGGWTLKLYFSFLIVPALMNLVFSRVGETILLELPIKWIGGPYTLEALLFGATAGIQIATLLTIMLVFGDLVTPQDLLRRTPAGLYPAGVTASIGLSFIPRAQSAFASLQEAQKIRGYKAKGIRDLPQLVTPLVILSLEQSISVAESLVSRGWGGSGLKGWKRWGVVAGLVSLALGLSGLVLSSPKLLLPAFMILFGILAIGVGLKPDDHSNRYRPELWARADSIVAGTGLGVLAIFLVLSIVEPAMLTSYPYPRIAMPEFKWPLFIAVGILSTPLWTTAND